MDLHELGLPEGKRRQLRELALDAGGEHPDDVALLGDDLQLVEAGVGEAVDEDDDLALDSWKDLVPEVPESPTVHVDNVSIPGIGGNGRQVDIDD